MWLVIHWNPIWHIAAKMQLSIKSSSPIESWSKHRNFLEWKSHTFSFVEECFVKTNSSISVYPLKNVWISFLWSTIEIHFKFEKHVQNRSIFFSGSTFVDAPFKPISLWMYSGIFKNSITESWLIYIHDGSIFSLIFVSLGVFKSFWITREIIR